jgi:PRTRC genetic system protein C
MSESTVKVLPRRFMYNNLALEDIDSNAAPDEIMLAYSEHYPELTEGHVEGPEITDDAMVYKFVTRLGTKGISSSQKKPVDFTLMREVAHALLRDGEGEEDGVELPPSEALEVI